MANKYIFFDNGSQEINDMQKFFDANDVPYITVYKPRDSKERIFPPNHKPSLDKRSFGDLKKRILEGSK